MAKRFIYNDKLYHDSHKIRIWIWNQDLDEQLSNFYAKYYFDNGEHHVDFSMPGSSKNKEKPQQTKFSVGNNLKTLFHKGMKGKAIFERLVKNFGGLEEVYTSADLPNSYNQIYDLSYKQKSNKTKVCNVQKGLPNAFIRYVRTAPELAVVVTNDQQLQDILTVCAMDHCWSIFGVDPTFNICSYNITISSYRHPVLYNVNSNVHPVLLGPTLIHSSKTFEPYISLPSVMLRLKLELSNLRAFGTDGEKKLFKAISTCFNKADHLLDWTHVKDNVSPKLESLCIETPNECMCEIFGKTSGTTKVKGLLDVTSEDQCHLEWKRLEEIWLGRGSKGALFLSYMNVNKRNMMKKCIIAVTRNRCGLGNPPDEYQNPKSK